MKYMHYFSNIIISLLVNIYPIIGLYFWDWDVVGIFTFYTYAFAIKGVPQYLLSRSFIQSTNLSKFDKRIKLDKNDRYMVGLCFAVLFSFALSANSFLMIFNFNLYTFIILGTLIWQSRVMYKQNLLSGNEQVAQTYLFRSSVPIVCVLIATILYSWILNLQFIELNKTFLLFIATVLFIATTVSDLFLSAKKG